MKDNITIRVGTINDIQNVTDFYMRLDNPDQKEWIEILMDGRHPYVNASNFILAIDTSIHKIVASGIYMPWNYSYNSVFMKGTRLEEIYCEPDYQNQGIMKKILSKIYELSAQNGSVFELVYGSNAVYQHLGFTYGIPNEAEGYYYILPEELNVSDFSITKANDSDIPFIVKTYQNAYQRNLLVTAIDSKEINYTKNIYVQGDFYIIKSVNGNSCGFFYTEGDRKTIFMLEIDDVVSYYQIRPALIDFYIKRNIRDVRFRLGQHHPVYTVFDGFHKQKLLSELGFIDIKNIPKFLMSISSVLNERITQSPYSHYSGKITIAVYNKDEAYTLSFINGKLIDVMAVSQNYGDVYIERSRLIKIIFGRVSANEMSTESSMYYFLNNDLKNLIVILFPLLQSHIVSIN